MASSDEEVSPPKKCRTCDYQADTFQERNEHEAEAHYNSNVR